MIYPAGFESKIGFTTLRELVSSHCLSQMGRNKCEAMCFSEKFDTVRRLLTQTSEMLSLIEKGVELPTDHMYDVVPSLKSIQAEGSALSAIELYRVRMSLDTLGRVHAFFSIPGDEDSHSVPELSSLFGALAVFPGVISIIDKVVNKYGDVADNASQTLMDIRRNIASSSASLSSIMRRVVDRGISAGILDKDTAPSMRDGRLVIPVSSAVKRQIAGIVHDESATGKTSYIEPSEVVEASNRLRELREAEKREVHRILVETADAIRPHISAMLGSYNMLGVYDFIRAKALVAKMFDAHMPILEKGIDIDWYGAVHPVLALSLKNQGREVVPLSLRLGGKNRILIISGPNAGGKSVCLKTAGIVQYMLQCGMLPPMYANSHACVFRNIFIDIGDEQSIENDLSTYSSHLRNMKTFMQKADSRTFILVDEMGTGTEPQIGGALAQAILVQLNQSHVMGIVTTHYQNLKTFADAQEGLVNGAMMYDRQNMQPLFRLSIGNPGSSFALEIARKTGLPVNVIDDARRIVGADYVNMDKYLLDLARDRKYWSEKRQSIKDKESKLETLLGKYEEQIELLKMRKRDILESARLEASELLARSNAKVERTILEIRNAQAEKEYTKRVRKELDEYKEQVAKTESEADVQIKGLPALPVSGRKKKKNPVPVKVTVEPEAPIAVGDYVRMSKGGMSGCVLSVSDKEAEVAFGAMRTRVALSKLIKALKPAESAATQITSVSKTTTDDSRKRQLDFKQEIDLRGMRADEALQAVAYFLDDAIQFCSSRVRILHGTGTGALRMAVRRYLQGVPQVVSFGDEDVRFGGAGITVVNLK